MTRRKATHAEINEAFIAARARLGRAMTIEEIHAIDRDMECVVERDELLVDSSRTDGAIMPTGILVRARAAGCWASVDIATLDRDSLLRWLRSRGGENLLAENCVLLLLGHKPEQVAAL
jgi:hypothetical protein